MRRIWPALLLIPLVIILSGCTAPERYGDLGTDREIVLKETPPAEVSGCLCMTCQYPDDRPWYTKLWQWLTGQVPSTQASASS